MKESFASCTIDEIALEGLDGITLEGLWSRLSVRLTIPKPFTALTKTRFWKIICSCNSLQIYELPEPRPMLVIFDRLTYIESEFDDNGEPLKIPSNIYPYYPVKDDNVRGSCQYFSTRRDITSEVNNLDVEEVEKRWGNKLVVVASQDLRLKALTGNIHTPATEILLVQYCILERVGRSRYSGEISSGPLSLQDVGEDPKALFYHRKILHRHKLIKKQGFYQRKISKNSSSSSLIHLPRFYTEFKSENLRTMEKVITFLKSKPNCLASYDDVRNALGQRSQLRKFFKTFEFKQLMNTDLKLPYRQVYPNAEERDWKVKGNDSEKNVRCIQLINPDIDIETIWNKEENLEDEDDELGILDRRNKIIELSVLAEAYRIIHNGGTRGYSQLELAKQMGLSKLNSRAICRHLLRPKLVTHYMDNVGRQRVTRFISKFHYNESKLLQLQLQQIQILSMKKNKKNDDETELVNNDENKNSTENVNGNGSSKRKLSCEETETKFTKKIKTENTSKRERIQDEECKNNAKRIKLENVSNNSNQEPKESRSEDEIIIDTKMSEENKSNIELPTANDFDKEIDRIETKISIVKHAPGVSDRSKGLFSENQSELPFSGLTYRVLKRVNSIIKLVQEEKVVPDLAKIMKMIHAEEQQEGYNVRMDKKSLMRLLMKLSYDGHLKIFRVDLKLESKHRNMMFICNSNIDADNTLITSEIELAKMKFSMVRKEELIEMPSEDPPQSEDVFSIDTMYKSQNELVSMEPEEKLKTNLKLQFSPLIGKKYGYAPKFIRMKVLHQFIFYVIRERTKFDGYDRKKALQILTDKGAQIDKELTEKLPRLYDDNISWKMFVPPLPNHKDWPKGWAIMCDILLRMPLSIFVKLHNVRYILPGIEKYLNDPIRKHFLVKNLPSSLRDGLLIGRRYIYSVHDSLIRLCYVGLIQLGPQRFKEKDQLFIYLNTKTTLLNTISSSPGYHQISEKDYEAKFYEFNSLADVDRYWYVLWGICIHTKLGKRICLSENEVIIETLGVTSALKKSLDPKSADEAPFYDNGEVPGDHRGAAGLDSAFFAHLKRNWHWSCSQSAKNATKKVTSAKKNKIEMFKQTNTQLATHRSNKKTKIISKSDFKTLQTAKPKRTISVRKYVSYKAVHQKKNPYDDVDRQALKLMLKLRVDWSPKEDHMLLLCKVASMFLYPNQRTPNVSFQSIRDILHQVTNSKNKTSKACQRRLLYMLKNPSTQQSVSMTLEEIKQCQDINNKFKNISKDKTDIAFIELVNILNKKFVKDSIVSHELSIIIPDSMKQLTSQYNIYNPQTVKDSITYQAPSTIPDIHVSVLRSVIQSSLCCGDDKVNWSYQLFKIYQNYSEQILRSVMLKVQKQQIIALKKIYLKASRVGSVPLTSFPYQLSCSYLQKMITKHPFEVFSESYNRLNDVKTNILSGKTEIEIDKVDGGTAAIIAEICTKDHFNFTVSVPDQVIILDPTINQVDLTFERISKRYQELLNSIPNLQASTSNVFTYEEEENAVASIIDESLTQPNIKNSSRIALYIMRGELNEGLDERHAQHMHDFFVVNANRIFLQYNNENDNDEDKDKSENFKNALNEALYSINSKTCENIYNDFQRTTTFINVNINMEEIHSELENTKICEELNIVFCDEVINYIENRSYYGVSSEEIVEKFSDNIDQSTMKLAKLLNFLCDKKVIYKLGVNGLYFVHHKHIDPWVVNSFKLKRLERESIDPLSLEIDNEAFYDMKETFKKQIDINNSNETQSSINSNIPIYTNPINTDDSKSVQKKSEETVNSSKNTTDIKSESIPCKDVITKESDREGNDSKNNKQIDQKSACKNNITESEINEVDTGKFNCDNVCPSNEELISKQNLRSNIHKKKIEFAPKTNFKSAESIKVFIAPWIRVDGSVNRRVLDRWLGAILNYCIALPGISIADICTRFQMLKPTEVYSLLEILNKITAVHFIKLNKKPCGLFSKPTPIEIAPATGLESFKKILIDPDSCAITKLGIFIGNKKYTKDFGL